MFTGIIRHKGRIITVRPGKLVLEVNLPEEVREGESVAVDGVCLTLVRRKGNQAEFDLSRVTWEKTAFRYRKAGQEVNIELPLKLSSFIGGHIVQGHVDGVGTVRRLIKRAESTSLCLQADREILFYLVEGASIAVNGVSLTVAGVERDCFWVELIPETLERTNLSRLAPGDKVNLEVDILAKYLLSYLKKGVK